MLFRSAHQRRDEEELEPARPLDVDEFRRQLGIIAAQDRVRTVQEGHLAAKTVEDAGELDRDIAASNDHDATRQGFEFEYLAGSDSMLDAVNLRNCGVCTSGVQYFLSAKALTRSDARREGTEVISTGTVRWGRS